MPTRTFLDANILIHALRASGEIGRKCRELLDDPDREWIASDILRLELIPKPHYNKYAAEVSFYEEYFSCVAVLVETTPDLVRAAETEARKAGLSAADSLHITYAKEAGASEFITAEMPTKPLFRVTGIKVISLHS